MSSLSGLKLAHDLLAMILGKGLKLLILLGKIKTDIMHGKHLHIPSNFPDSGYSSIYNYLLTSFHTVYSFVCLVAKSCPNLLQPHGL